MRILAKAIIVNPEGEIVDFALNSPFMYLLSIKDNIGISSQPGLNQVLYRPQEPFDDSIERFFALLRFEQRGKLDGLEF